ncbi:MOSC domain-containing protein [Bacillus sp. UMB0899]|nr:MOSC domain-containing protein [Bacillus sp. UMB0899]
MNHEIVWLSKGTPSTLTYKGKEYKSGIAKNQVSELNVTLNGIIGDDVENHEFHGGSERVICVYAYEHYGFWGQLYQHILPKAAFGENLTLKGMTESDVNIGDIYQIGEAIVQVSQGRFPCSTINKYTNIPTLLNKIIEHGYTGYFFRVLEEGTIYSNSSIKLLEKHPKGLSISTIHHTFFHDKENIRQIEAILSLDTLSKEWKNRLNKLHNSITKNSDKSLR